LDHIALTMLRSEPVGNNNVKIHAATTTMTTTTAVTTTVESSTETHIASTTGTTQCLRKKVTMLFSWYLRQM